MEIISIILATAVPIALIGALVNRCVVTSETERGNVVRGTDVGWQIIRFCVLTSVAGS